MTPSTLAAWVTLRTIGLQIILADDAARMDGIFHGQGLFLFGSTRSAQHLRRFHRHGPEAPHIARERVGGDSGADQEPGVSLPG